LYRAVSHNTCHSVCVCYSTLLYGSAIPHTWCSSSPPFLHSTPRDARTHARSYATHHARSGGYPKKRDSERSKNKTRNSSRGKAKELGRFRQPLSPIPLHTLRHCWVLASYSVPAAAGECSPPLRHRCVLALIPPPLLSHSLERAGFCSSSAIWCLSVESFHPYLVSGLSPGTSIAKFVLWFRESCSC
jgi:hypothetical protein